MNLSAEAKKTLKDQFCPARSKPDDYEPPYPAYVSTLQGTTHYTTAMLGIQAKLEGAGSALLFEILGLMGRDGENRPLFVETSWHIDSEGYRNDIVMPYWRTPDEMDGFFNRKDVAAWRLSALRGEVGWWRESLAAPVTSLDGGYSVPDSDYGVARYSDVDQGQFFGYMGSMRDRIPDYLSGAADGPDDGQLTRGTSVESFGRHLVIENLPGNLCFIRGAWGWTRAEPEEQRAFQENMLPVLTEGSMYLRDNPVDSGCISMRQTRSTHIGYDNNVEVEALGWFLTLQELERWTRSHPRHLAILAKVAEHAQSFNGEMRLNLGHEVVVVPAGGVYAEYNNCHPETGFLPFFSAVPQAE
ncbi:phenylacetaldoxime dehydratase family protein [Rhodococcus sp. USK13]|uniref:phenylacetaldoxime dehydratase family protein n=1 Tax=Rhodococcus sp. USK13 TaxID=2806442 RepID=UPI001BCF94C5|nr:phenylacetaldoxime dehydratase family protein [Rhodococcus sp. USK13]